jgi:hypothetical protein
MAAPRNEDKRREPDGRDEHYEDVGEPSSKTKTESSKTPTETLMRMGIPAPKENKVDAELRALCEHHGVEYISEAQILAWHMVASSPIKDVLQSYYAKIANKDDRVISWEKVLCTIKSGSLSEFKFACDQDPGLATRVGTEELGTCPIHVAASYVAALPILEWLLTLPGIDVTIKSKTGKSPLDYAVTRNNPHAVRALLHHSDCLATLSPNSIPPYIEGENLTEEALTDIFSIMQLLPTTQALWDPRWALLRAMKQAKGTVEICMMCMAIPPSTVVFPCGHKVVCKECSARLKTDAVNRSLCIYCREPITAVYLPDEDAMQRT